MSNGATTELNFLPASNEFPSRKLFDHGRNIRVMQRSMSKIDPEVLKNMLASTTTNVKSPETSPLTIFYNGTVSIFEVPRDKAEAIMRLAREENKKPEPVMAEAEAANGEQNLLEKLNGDLPIARKKSLQRFLEKRRERLTCSSPYAAPNSGSGSETVVEKKKI